jgi:hypothetical protein
MNDYPYPTSTSLPHSPNNKQIQSSHPLPAKKAISKPKISAIPPPRPTTAAPTTFTILDPAKMHIDSGKVSSPDMPPIPGLPEKQISDSTADSPTDTIKTVDEDENVTLLELVSNLTMAELNTDKDTTDIKQEEVQYNDSAIQYDDSTKKRDEKDMKRKFSKLFKKEKMSIEYSDGEEEIKNSPYSPYNYNNKRRSEKKIRGGKSERRIIDSDKESSSCEKISPEGRRPFRRVSSVNTSRRASKTRSSTRSFDEYPDKKLKTLKNSKNTDRLSTVKTEMQSPRKNSSSKPARQQKVDNVGILSKNTQKEAFAIDAVLDQLFSEAIKK